VVFIAPLVLSFISRVHVVVQLAKDTVFRGNCCVQIRAVVEFEKWENGCPTWSERGM